MAEGPGTLPHSRLGRMARFPWVTVSLAAIIALAELLSLTPWRDLLPASPAALLGFSFLLLLAGAVLEYAIGPVIQLIALVLAALLAVAATFFVSGSWPQGFDWLPLAGAATVGLNLGLFQRWRTRPLYFVPGPPGRLAFNGFVLVGLWIAYEVLAWWAAGGSGWPWPPSICFVVGLGFGLALTALSETRPSVISPGYIEQLVESGAAEVEALIKLHKVPRACRIIDRLVQLAPEDMDLKRLRYAVWKYRPNHDAFHAAAADLLNRRGDDPASNAFVETMYQDYVAVSQGRPRLPVDFHLRLAERFARNLRVEDAAIIINVHLQRDPKHPSIPSALLALANGYLLTDRDRRAAFYADTLLHLFPDSPQSGAAREMLERVSPDDNN